MIPAEVQAIFFDAVGTLIFPDPAAAEVYAEIGRRHGSRLSVDVVRTRFAAAFAREEALDRAGRLQTSEDRERLRWQNIVVQVLDDVTDAAACFHELYEHFARPNAWHVDPNAALVMKKLKRRGYILGLASNYDHRLRAVVAGLPALADLQHLVISSEVGWRKPAPEFFAALCREVSLPPGSVLYVGDDPINDYQGARDFGMAALIVSSSHPGGALRRIAEGLLEPGQCL